MLRALGKSGDHVFVTVREGIREVKAAFITDRVATWPKRLLDQWGTSRLGSLKAEPL
jgi:hypothetical protein